MTTRSGRFHAANLLAIWLMVASAWQVLAVDPVVSNVQAKQREGSRLVDITYDVADPDSPTLTVYLKVSPDGGKTWVGPVELVNGDVGQHIAPGTAKKLVWDAGKEMANQFGVNFRYRIGASDQWIGESGMSFIPSGSFQMGDERVTGPVHTVLVSAFAIDKREVSIELWESVRAWGNAHGYDLVAGGAYGAKHPVQSVNWFDVVKWCNARSEKNGKLPAYYEDYERLIVYRTGNKVPAGVRWDTGYKLPTEAEWEKAARGGVEGKLYPWGTDEISPSLANYYGSNKGQTTPIGSYGANWYGLYDMAGNVFEWCWDWYNGSNCVTRGGSWDNGDDRSRVANRHNTNPDLRSNNYGFRCALAPSQP